MSPGQPDPLWPFTVAEEDGRWSVYDTEERRHLGRRYRHRRNAEERLASLRGRRPYLVRFILARQRSPRRHPLGSEVSDE